MNQLQIINQNGQLLADSREIAEMIAKPHDQLMRSIRTYIEYLTSAKMQTLEFFKESTYVDGKGEIRPCYLLTKKGCDMVANKMTGEKGVLFTATYVTKFEEMQQQLNQLQAPSYTIEDPIERAKKWIEEQQKVQMLEQRVNEYEPKITYLDQILKSKNTVTITQIAKDYGLSGQELNKILNEEKVQYKLNSQWLLYRKYQDKGYTKSQTIDVIHSDGSQTVKMNTRWTQKGRLFIHEILNQRNIVPVLDRELVEV